MANARVDYWDGKSSKVTNVTGWILSRVHDVNAFELGISSTAEGAYMMANMYRSGEQYARAHVQWADPTVMLRFLRRPSWHQSTWFYWQGTSRHEIRTTSLPDANGKPTRLGDVVKVSHAGWELDRGYVLEVLSDRFVIAEPKYGGTRTITREHVTRIA